jgi:hypothetical protein
MAVLTRSISAWDTASFAATLQAEIEQLGARQLPLHRATAHGGLVADSAISAMFIRSSANDDRIEADVGVFFTEIVINCGCGDEPYETSAYGVLHVVLDRHSGSAVFDLVDH